MSEYGVFLGPGRWALITSGVCAGEVVRVVEWDHGFEMWVVNLLGEDMLKQADELEPVFTMDQVINVKIEEQRPGSDLIEKAIPFGMSSEELADATEAFITKCSNRIKGVGDKQYSEEGGYQRFEEMDLDDLFEYIDEEIQDIPNYCTMLHIRITRLREALKVADVIQEEEEIPSD